MVFDSLIPGMTVYTTSRQKMGNTNLSTVRVNCVRIVSIDTVRQTCRACFNYLPERTYTIRDIAKWRVSKPVLVKSGWGHRLATRSELKAMKDAPTAPTGESRDRQD